MFHELCLFTKPASFPAVRPQHLHSLRGSDHHPYTWPYENTGNYGPVELGPELVRFWEASPITKIAQCSA